jgi:hypothetical protein
VTKPVEEFAGQLWTAWYEEFANRVPGLAIKIAKSYKRQLGFQVISGSDLSKSIFGIPLACPLKMPTNCSLSSPLQLTSHSTSFNSSFTV